MVSGWVTDEEEGEISRIWISFGKSIQEVATANRELWKESLWQSDQLGEDEHIQSVKDAFKQDVIGLAKKYLAENKLSLIEEAQNLGINLEKEKLGPIMERPGYLEALQSVAPNVLKFKEYSDELREIRVGYKTEYFCHEHGCYPYEVSATFNPQAKPEKPPKGTESPPWPTWEEVSKEYIRVNTIIDSFADLCPTLYILIQQGKLEELVEAGDATKAKETINEAMRGVYGKLEESEEKIDTGDIAYYDLVMMHSQLFNDSAKVPYTTAHPWDQPYYMDIVQDILNGHKARQFWADLGLSLAAAAALIAAPFTGGATLGFLLGFGIGVGVGQAAVSWEKYLDLATLGDAEVKQELALVSEGQISAQLVESIINTVAVFLDVYGVTRGIGAGAKAGVKASRAAYEAAEKELKEQVAEETRKKMLREAGKDIAMEVIGTGVAVGLHELGQEEIIPAYETLVGGAEIDSLESSEPSSNPINRMVIQRDPLKKGDIFELMIERALKNGELLNGRVMDVVIPGKYIGSDWGVDRFGIRIHESGKISVYQFEMKFVEEGSTRSPELGTSKAGRRRGPQRTQTGLDWTKNAVDKFFTSKNPTARAMQRRLIRALQKMYPNERITLKVAQDFLAKRMKEAKVIIVTVDDANLEKLYRQRAALIKAGRKVDIVTVTREWIKKRSKGRL